MTKTVQIPDFVKIIKCFWYKISSNHLEKKKKIKVEAKEKSIPSSKVKSKSPDIENRVDLSEFIRAKQCLWGNDSIE